MTNEEFAKAKLECREQAAAILTFDNLTIVRKGVYLWVSGDTKRHHVGLKGAGFSFAPLKKLWYWKPRWAKVSGEAFNAIISDVESFKTEVA